METKKIGEIREEFKAAEETMLPSFIEKYRSDERAGVQKLIEQANGRLAKLEAERARIDRLWKYEREYGMYTRICGIDEVGRGPLAGPVVAGAVILPKDCDILYINDSKKLSAAKREELYDVIMEKAVAVGIGMVGPERIDEINILQATYEAMREAISKLGDAPDILLNDAVTIPGVAIRQVPIIKGDAKSISIGAASIVAKVTRDRLMVEYDKIMPGYGFAATGSGSAGTVTAGEAAEPTGVEAMRSAGKEFWASSMKCWMSLRYSALNSSREALRRSISSSSACFSVRAWRITSRALASASLRIRSAFSLASLTMVSAVCWAAIRAAEIWRS